MFNTSLARAADEQWTFTACVWALASLAAAMAARFLLDPVIGDALTYITAFAAISVSAWGAGWRSGLLCAVLCQVFLNYFFIAPRGVPSFTVAVLVGTAAYYVVVALLLYPAHRARRALFERDQAVAQLRKASDGKSHFLALLAHELRGPIHTARLAVHGADRADIGEPRRRAAHAVILRQLEHVARLCEGLMDTAKIEQNKISLDLRPARVGELLERAVEACRTRLDERSQHVQVSSEVDSLDLVVDPVRMVQVIRNLVDNASKYSPAGSTVLVTAALDGSTFSLKVADTGIGFDAEQADRLFETFFQAVPGSDGLGLGLPLVRRLVDLHGGQVLASSPGLGMGATFEVRLPHAAASTAAQRPAGATA